MLCRVKQTLMMTEINLFHPMQPYAGLRVFLWLCAVGNLAKLILNEMFCDSETITSPVETQQSNFKSRSATGNVYMSHFCPMCSAQEAVENYYF